MRCIATCSNGERCSRVHFIQKNGFCAQHDPEHPYNTKSNTRHTAKNDAVIVEKMLNAVIRVANRNKLQFNKQPVCYHGKPEPAIIAIVVDEPIVVDESNTSDGGLFRHARGSKRQRDDDAEFVPDKIPRKRSKKYDF